MVKLGFASKTPNIILTACHLEVHRSTLYASRNSIQIRCHEANGNDNAAEHTLDDDWNNERKVLLQKEWVNLPEGYTWVNGRPTRSPTSTWPEELAQSFTET